MNPLSLKSWNSFHLALALSIAAHGALLVYSNLNPSPTVYPVQSAPQSVELVMVEEILKDPEPPLEIQEELLTAPLPSPEEIPMPELEVEPETEEPPIDAWESRDDEPIEALPSEASVGAFYEAEPLPVVNPSPVYPRLARRRGWEGTVLLEVRVGPDGRPLVVQIVQSSGYAVLDEEALETVRAWRFQPARQGMLPVSSTVHIPVLFKLVDH